MSSHVFPCLPMSSHISNISTMFDGSPKTSQKPAQRKRFWSTTSECYIYTICNLYIVYCIYCIYTVDTVYTVFNTVDTVYTVFNTVDTVYTVYTVDTVYTVYTEHANTYYTCEYYIYFIIHIYMHILRILYSIFCIYSAHLYTSLFSISHTIHTKNLHLPYNYIQYIIYIYTT